MWYSVLISIITTLCLCLIIVNLHKRTHLIANTSIEFNFIGTKQFEKQDNFSEILIDDGKGGKSSKRRIHIPKFMLDLYEAGKREDYRMNVSKPDIVRSVIPKNGGKF